MPKLSVIIPVYKTQASYLGQSLSSVLAAAPKDSEMLIGVDGCLDNEGLNLLDRIQGQRHNTNVRVLKYNRQGLAQTLNALIQQTDCEFIARQDSDDVCCRKRFGEQIDLMEGCKNVAFCGTQVIRCDENLQQLKRQRKYPTRFKMQLLYASLLNNPIAHPTLMARRDILPKKCYQEVRLAEDWDLYIRLWQAGHTSINLKTPGLLYRTHSNQATKSVRETTDLRDLKERSLNAAIQYDSKFRLVRPLQDIGNLLKVTEAGIKAKAWLDK